MSWYRNPTPISDSDVRPRHRVRPTGKSGRNEQSFADSTSLRAIAFQELVRLVGKPNNSSMLQPAEAKHWCFRAAERTIVRLRVQQPDGRTRDKLGSRANNRRNLPLFCGGQLAGPGTQSEQLFVFRPAGLKTNKKNQG